MITKDFLKNYSQGIQIYFEETLKSSYGIICDLFDQFYELLMPIQKILFLYGEGPIGKHNTFVF